MTAPSGRVACFRRESSRGAPETTAHRLHGSGHLGVTRQAGRSKPRGVTSKPGQVGLEYRVSRRPYTFEDRLPSPIAHGIGGLAAALSVAPRQRACARLVVAVFVIAVLPDLDFLAGFAVGSPHRFHRGPTHSLVGSAILAALVAPLLPSILSGPHRSPPRPFASAWALAFVVLLSHLIADAVMPDPGGGVGVPILWPFTSEAFAAPLPLPASLANALEIRFDGPTGYFLSTLFSARTGLVFLLEGLLFTPLLMLPVAVRRAWRSRADSRDLVAGCQGKMPRSR